MRNFLSNHSKFFGFIVFLLGSRLTAQTYFPPLAGNQWDTLSPKRFGYCEERIDSLYAVLDRNHSKAFILLKDGKIVLEKYFDKFTQDSNWYWASAGKTLTAAVVGILEGQKKLSLTEKTSTYLGEAWTSLSKQQEDSITIWHQLTMTSGLDDAPENADCTDPSCLTYKSPVGQRWAYHNAPYTLLDQVIAAASGKSINQVVYTELALQMGLKVVYLKIGPNNVAFSTPRNFARFGVLLLNQGKWASKQLIPSDFFHNMVATSQNLNPSYGYLTWLNGKEKFMVPQSQFRFSGDCMPGGPSDLFMALGKDGQQIHVSPSENLVWIRMGESPETQNPLVSMDLGAEIWERINALSCGNLEITTLETQNMVLSNPLVAGSELPIQTGILVDVSGRVTHFSDGKLPVHLAAGLYYVRWIGGSRRIVVVE